ncbi:MAG: TetR/AcrR family transcriptional regulator [Rhodospirillales bacterium]
MAVSDDKRAQILDAAVEEFQEHGFAATSMDRIAERAQVSKRTVYNHFEGKEALFHAICDIVAAEVNRALDVAFDPEQAIEPQLIALGWSEGRLMISPSFMKLARMTVGETLRDPDLAADMTVKMKHLPALERFFAAAHGAGVLQVPDPTLAGEQFIGLIKARAFWPAVISGEPLTSEEMEQVIRQSVDFFMKNYAP